MSHYEKSKVSSNNNLVLYVFSNGKLIQIQAKMAGTNQLCKREQ